MLEGARSNNVGSFINEVASQGKEINFVRNMVVGGGGRGRVGRGKGEE